MVAIDLTQYILGLIVVRPNVVAVDIVFALHLANDYLRVTPYEQFMAADTFVDQIVQTID